MVYSVADGALTQTFRVTNTGDVTLPFTVGGHPAFNVPAPGAADESFSDYALEFCEPWTARVPKIDEAGLHDFSKMTELLSDSDRLELSHDLFERLLTLVFVEVPGRRVRLVGPSGHGRRGRLRRLRLPRRLDVGTGGALRGDRAVGGLRDRL